MARYGPHTAHEFDDVGSSQRDFRRAGQHAASVSEAIANVESLKVRVLEWPGLTEAARAEFFRTLDSLRGTLIQSIQVRETVAPLAQPARPSRTRMSPDEMRLEGIIGQSPEIQKILRILAKIAPTDLSVLMEGETGVGKELFARIIHANSGRANFVAVNCGAFPAGLIESELFGHLKGAFTGATSNRKGKFEEADGGTIFLDEIGELDLSAQVKLLRVLESGELQRVGSDKLTATDVRVIAATNQDLRQMIEEHRFRDDLYYRLNVCPLFIPPLRERRDEIPILFEYFFNEYRSTSGRPTPPLTSDLAEFLYASYDYPGNIRELKNLSRYLAQVGGASALTLSDLPGTYLEHLSAAPDTNEAGEQAPLMLARASAERDKLLRVLQARHGDVASVCRELSISRSRLYQLFKKHDVNPKTYRRR